MEQKNHHKLRAIDNSVNLNSKLGGDIEKLRFLDGERLCDIKKENSNLLIFPQNWELGIGGEEKIFELDKYENLITGNIMGFVGYEDEDDKTELIISSRFSQGDGNDFFLHYMLCKVFGINVVNLDFTKGELDIHDFLPYLFSSYLQNALSQGLYKQYKRNHYNDANVKGTIDINRHIRINIPFAGKVSYTTREHSYDNHVTQLIRHTIEHLRTRDFGHSVLTKDSDTRANVSQIEYATSTYKRNDLQKIVNANLKLVNHPYFTKYKDLQKLCLQILRREGISFAEDSKDKIHGLLFDGAWLWEAYVNTLIGDKFWHPDNNKKTGEQYLFKGIQTIYPDFISNKLPRIIADAKYKPTGNIGRNDYFQVLAYMYRFDAKEGYYIYPNANDQESIKKLELLKGVREFEETEESRSDKIILTKLGLKIPQEYNDFGKFKEKMNFVEDELKKIMQV